MRADPPPLADEQIRLLLLPLIAAARTPPRLGPASEEEMMVARGAYNVLGGSRFARSLALDREEVRGKFVRLFRSLRELHARRRRLLRGTPLDDHEGERE